MAKLISLMTLNRIKLIILLFFIVFISVLFLFTNVKGAEAASISYDGLTPGFSGVSCAGAADDWLAVRVYLKDAATNNPIAGTVTVQCKYDFRSNWADPSVGCGASGGSTYYCEGPDAVHPTFEWYAVRCASGNVASGSARCMGGCTLPFNLSATAPGYTNSPTWLVNHGASSATNFYPEGNTNTANYTIKLDAVPVTTLNVRSAGASGVAITGTNSMGGTTNYTKTVTNAAISTTLTAPALTASDTRRFSSWSGCDSIPGNRQCGVSIGNGGSQTVTANYVDNEGTILGRIWRDDDGDGSKDAVESYIRRNAAVACAGVINGNARVDFTGPESGTRYPVLCNPTVYYSTGKIIAGTYTVTAVAPTGWQITSTSPTTCTLVGGDECHKWFGMRPVAELKIDIPLPVIGNELHVDDEKTIDVYFRNSGTKSANNFKLEFCYDGNSTTYRCNVAWDSKNIALLPANDSPVYESFAFNVPDNPTFPVTKSILVRVDLPDTNGDGIGDPPGVIPELNEVNNNRATRSYTVIGPPPWIQSRGGDVGSFSQIYPEDPPTGPGAFSAEYLVIADDVVNTATFTSAKGWLVQNYDPPDGINLWVEEETVSQGDSIYDALFHEYSKQCQQSENITTPGVLAGKVSHADDCKFVLHSGGDLTIDNSAWGPPGAAIGYTGNPAVVFVNGNMTIQNSIGAGDETGLIFVVKGNITVASNVTQTDGMYIFDGDYTVNSTGISSALPGGEEQLTVNGAVIGGFKKGLSVGKIDLNRDFRSTASRTTPTELFNYDPKYLWLFR
ncbi:MAG TPA: hypothetical protein VF303_04805, partial [Candidatus Nanoarchaeia archaeon]